MSPSTAMSPSTGGPFGFAAGNWVRQQTSGVTVELVPIGGSGDATSGWRSGEGLELVIGLAGSGFAVVIGRPIRCQLPDTRPGGLRCSVLVIHAGILARLA